jgi:hypothetical protein
MSIPDAWPQVLDFLGTPLVIERSPDHSAAWLPPSGCGAASGRRYPASVGDTGLSLCRCVRRAGHIVRGIEEPL